MSKGPGKRQAAIEAVFTSEHDDIFSLDDLVAIAFPGLNRVEKKHRVATARSAAGACRQRGWMMFHREAKGGGNVYFNKRSLRSYSLARVRCDSCCNDLSTGILRQLVDDKDTHGWNHRFRSREDLMKPGGAWFNHVQCWRAELDGTDEEREAAQKLVRRQTAAVMSALRIAS